MLTSSLLLSTHSSGSPLVATRFESSSHLLEKISWLYTYIHAYIHTCIHTCKHIVHIYNHTYIPINFYRRSLKIWGSLVHIHTYCTYIHTYIHIVHTYCTYIHMVHTYGKFIHMVHTYIWPFCQRRCEQASISAGWWGFGQGRQHTQRHAAEDNPT